MAWPKKTGSSSLDRTDRDKISSKPRSATLNYADAIKRMSATQGVGVRFVFQVLGGGQVGGSYVGGRLLAASMALLKITQPSWMRKYGNASYFIKQVDALGGQTGEAEANLLVGIIGAMYTTAKGMWGGDHDAAKQVVLETAAAVCTIMEKEASAADTVTAWEKVLSSFRMALMKVPGWEHDGIDVDFVPLMPPVEAVAPFPMPSPGQPVTAAQAQGWFDTVWKKVVNASSAMVAVAKDNPEMTAAITSLLASRVGGFGAGASSLLGAGAASGLQLLPGAGQSTVPGGVPAPGSLTQGGSNLPP